MSFNMWLRYTNLLSWYLWILVFFCDKFKVNFVTWCYQAHLGIKLYFENFLHTNCKTLEGNTVANNVGGQTAFYIAACKLLLVNEGQNRKVLVTQFYKYRMSDHDILMAMWYSCSFFVFLYYGYSLEKLTITLGKLSKWDCNDIQIMLKTKVLMYQIFINCITDKRNKIQCMKK